MAYDSSEQAAPDMTCREVVKRTSAYLDEHLDDALNIRMVLHLAACAGCQAYVQQIASIRDLLGLLPRMDAEPAQRDRLREAFLARQNPPLSTG